jgi:Family of unknown function (DUF6445)
VFSTPLYRRTLHELEARQTRQFLATCRALAHTVREKIPAMDPGISAANATPHRPAMRLERIGHAQAPVLVIDDFHPDPGSLVAQAVAQGGFSATSKFYPGVRTRGTLEYVQMVRDRLRAIHPQDFGPPNDVIPTECNFSLVTLPAGETVPFQRIPHFDGTDVHRIAVLHYLCAPHHGGTAFYRHRSTGYEVITPENVQAYTQALDQDISRCGMPAPGYVNGSTPLFERIAAYDAVFNRALVYRGTSLHSGSIPADFVPDPSPRSGRLTLNTFLELRLPR